MKKMITYCLLFAILVGLFSSNTYGAMARTGFYPLVDSEYTFNGLEGLAVDGEGNIYIADTFNYCVKKYSSSGNLMMQFGYYGTGEGEFTGIRAIAIDGDGNIYTTDYNGDVNRVQKFDLNGNFLTQWGTLGSGQGQFDYPSGIAVDSSNNVYVVDVSNSRIQKFNSNGQYLSQWGSAELLEHAFNFPRGIAIDALDNVYVTDTGNHVIKIFDTEGVYKFQLGSNGSGSGQFQSPYAVAVDIDGNVYVTDTGNYRVQKYSVATSTWMAWGLWGAEDGFFIDPKPIVVDGSGKVYVADTENDRIQIFDAMGNFIEKWSLFGNNQGQFSFPQGISVDTSNNFYVADTENHRIQKFNSYGEYIIEWGSMGIGDGEFISPIDVFVDDADNVFVVDFLNDRIQKFNTDGDFLMKFGGHGTDDGQFDGISGITSDPLGNLYVTDSRNNRVQVFDSEGNFIFKFGTQGSGEGEFDSPVGIVIDTQDYIYVKDTNNKRIQKFTTAGIFVLAFGGGGSDDGQFDYPSGIAVDSYDNIYVSDMFRSSVQKFDSSGNFIQKWGSYGHESGQFSYPQGIAIDQDGFVYVVDSGNGRVQMMLLYTLVFDKNGGDTEASPRNMGLAVRESISSMPTPPSRTGYTFSGWNTQADGSGYTLTTEMGIMDNSVVYAQWTPVSSGGSSGGSGSGSDSPVVPIVTTPPVPVPIITETPSNGGGSASITSTATSEGILGDNGVQTASFTKDQVAAAIDEALAALSGRIPGTQTKVEIKVATTTESRTIEANLPKIAFTSVLEGQADQLILTTPLGNMTFDQKALSTITGDLSDEVKVSTSLVDVSSLTDESKLLVSNRPVYNFAVTSGEKTISKFGGNIKVSVPYTLQEGESPNAIIVYYINEQGELEMVKASNFDSETGMVTFETNHFSMYAVGYNKVEFSDVDESAWYCAAIQYIAARDIASGMGDNQYCPNEALTRAQFLIMVMKAYGIELDENAIDNFVDGGDTYYTDYLATAKALGISSGIGDNMFAPNKEITRQEMFTLLYNVLELLDALPSESSDQTIEDFNDEDDIASWAMEAVTLFVESGTISGNGGMLAPTSESTRAEMAQLLYNLLNQ